MSACLPGARLLCIVCTPSEPEAALGIPVTEQSDETRGLVVGLPIEQSSAVVRGIELEQSKTANCIARTFYCSGNIKTLHD